MKLLDIKEARSAASKGLADHKEISRAMISPKQEDYDLDEREPMERMADEMEKFSKAIGDMNKKQLDAISQMMKTVLSIVEKKGAEVEQPVTVTIQDTRPMQWSIDVAKRDSDGRIEKINLTAKKETLQ